MRRYHITDVAIKWVHGSIGRREFDELLERHFYFFNARPSRPADEEEYRANRDKLYGQKMRERLEAQARPEPQVSVIGHGDPGFANTLYNQATKMFLFIDPRGALTEEELWTHPYYDVAKLSHCICGLYDFFNNGLI